MIAAAVDLHPTTAAVDLHPTAAGGLMITAADDLHSQPLAT